MSEALILESVNPQYDERLFIDFQEKCKFTTCCVQKLFFFLLWHSKQYLYTTCCELVFFGEFNKQSLVILWVNWFKNESFWKRFTCTTFTVKLIKKGILFQFLSLANIISRTTKHCKILIFLFVCFRVLHSLQTELLFDSYV